MYSYHVNTDFTNLAYPQGFEPRPTVLETVMLPLTPGIYFYSIEIKSPIIWTAMSTNIDAILNATNSICFPLLCVVLVETDGFEPPRFLGARFTVWCNQPLCHVSKISIGYLCVDKPLLGRLFIVRHFFINVNVARSGFCNHPLRRPSVALRLRMEFLDNLVHDTRIELVFPP